MATSTSWAHLDDDSFDHVGTTVVPIPLSIEHVLDEHDPFDLTTSPPMSVAMTTDADTLRPNETSEQLPDDEELAALAAWENEGGS
jgi:hypothetical protein